MRPLLFALAAFAGALVVGVPSAPQAQGCAFAVTPNTYEAMRDRVAYLVGEELAGYNMIASGDSFYGIPRVESGGRFSRTTTTPYVPPTLLKAIGYIESALAQAANSVPWGAVGPVLVSFDCGYGIMQITSGMTSPEDNGWPSGRQALIATHFLYNIGRGSAILVDKWNDAPEARPIVGDGNPRIVEHWYYALWSYNGFASSNNPMNFSAERTPYSCDVTDGFSHNRSLHPYQDLVYGCAARPPRVDGRQLWTPLPATLPNQTDPAFSSAFNNFPNSSLMDIPAPQPVHEDPTRRPNDAAPSLLTGSPSLSVSRTSVEGTVNQVTISNSGSGIVAWRAKPQQNWLGVDKQAGVALAPSVPCSAGAPCERSPVLTITVDTALAPATGEGQVTIESLTNGQRIDIRVVRGPTVLPNGMLIKGSGPAVFVVRRGIIRHIPNMPSFEANGFNSADVVRVPDVVINLYPRGQPLLNVLANGNLLKGSGTAIYAMQSFAKRHLTSMTAMQSCGYGSDEVHRISDGQLNSIGTGAALNGPPCPVLIPAPGRLLKGSGSAVYVMSGGQKRHIANVSVFEACGYHWGNLNVIADRTLNRIPTGPSLSASPCP